VPSPVGSTDGAQPPPAPRKGPRVQETANAHWELFVGLGPAFLLLVFAGTGALVVAVRPSAVTTVASYALVLALAALAWVAVAMTAAVVNLLAQLARVGRRRSQVAVGQVSAMHWSAVFVHAADVEALPDLLHDAQQAANGPVIVPEAALTSSTARNALTHIPGVHELAVSRRIRCGSA
jgi:hypothetical protein